MKVGILMICVNPLFWPYAAETIATARPRLFKGEEVEYILWTDIPKPESVEALKVLTTCKTAAELEAIKAQGLDDQQFNVFIKIPVTEEIQGAMEFLNTQKDIVIVPTDPVEWPYPTLLRYHLFTAQEEYLQKFDKLLYLDADMRVVADIDTSIFGEGLTCAKHPMYALDRRFIPPLEPNPSSTAYIPRLGQILTDNKGKYWFDPVYAAGGIQGGATGPFIDAMWSMKRAIDKDLMNNYTAIWNDESHWNKYLWEHADNNLIVLGPEYVYPDSMIESYYEWIWGRKYTPKIITVTKRHSLSRLGGKQLAAQMQRPTMPFVCPTCHDILAHPQDCRIIEVKICEGKNKNHDVIMEKAV